MDRGGRMKLHADDGDHVAHRPLPAAKDHRNLPTTSSAQSTLHPEHSLPVIAAAYKMVYCKHSDGGWELKLNA